MKKYMLYILLLAPFLFGSIPANADGINFSLVSTTYDYSSPANIVFDDKSTGFSLTYSYYVDPTWSIDLNHTEYGTAERSFGLIDTEVETSSHSVAVRGTTTVGTIGGHDINAHGLLGLVLADMKISVGSNSLSDNDSGVVYGAGLSAKLSPVDELTLMYKKADLDFDNTVNFEYNPSTFELGYTRSF